MLASSARRQDHHEKKRQSLPLPPSLPPSLSLSGFLQGPMDRDFPWDVVSVTICSIGWLNRISYRKHSLCDPMLNDRQKNKSCPSTMYYIFLFRPSLCPNWSPFPPSFLPSFVIHPIDPLSVLSSSVCLFIHLRSIYLSIGHPAPPLS